MSLVQKLFNAALWLLLFMGITIVGLVLAWFGVMLLRLTIDIWNGSY